MPPANTAASARHTQTAGHGRTSTARWSGLNRILSRYTLRRRAGEWLQKLEGLAAYAKDLEEYAQQALLDGRSLPGWKLVQGRSTRKWTDQDAAFRQMQADGIDEAMLYTRTPISLTAAEKMIGKKKFAETMSAFITRHPRAQAGSSQRPAPCLQPLRGFKPEED